MNVTDFVEAHHRTSEVRYVCFVPSEFFPATALEEIVDDVPRAFHVLGQEVLEGATPQRYRSVRANQAAELVKVRDVVLVKCPSDVMIQHVLFAVSTNRTD